MRPAFRAGVPPSPARRESVWTGGEGNGGSPWQAASQSLPPFALSPSPSPTSGRGEPFSRKSLPYSTCANFSSPFFTYIEFFGCANTRRTIGSKNDSGSVS